MPLTIQRSGCEEGRMMGRRSVFCCCHLLIVFVAITQLSTWGTDAALRREDFPQDFVFGAGTSAYQVEGAAAEDGRKPSIWDTFSHAGKVMDESTGDVASDQYHKYKEDVKLMHEMGLEAYRFSISWARLIPDGRGEVNPKGLQYYNNLMDELTRYGIDSHVTLNHFDLPQSLEDEYGGYLSSKFIDDFTAFAGICFKEFGDRVKTWITFNEPNFQALVGYDLGVHAPGRCSYPFGFNCSSGNSSTEVYIYSHNILLAHTAAVNLYRDKYQEKQRGRIGITILGLWFEPATNSSEDIAATKRVLHFHLGWFLDPLMFGNYPTSMRKVVGSRLPFFTENQTKQLKGSIDFIGINHYAMLYVQSLPSDVDRKESDYLSDIGAKIFGAAQQEVLRKNFLWLKDTSKPSGPWGLQKVLEYMKLNYANPLVFIHENGYGTNDIPSTNENSMDDFGRIGYIQGYIEGMLQSIRNGSNARGYFVWSFIDCFELSFGYTSHYGLYKVDFQDRERTRYPRLSARWYSTFLRKHTVLKQNATRSSPRTQ